MTGSGIGGGRARRDDRGPGSPAASDRASDPPETRISSKRVRALLAAALAAAALSCVLAATRAPVSAQAQSNGAQAPVAPIEVGVAPAREVSLDVPAKFTGRIQSPSRVDLVARVVAYLDRRSFREGSEVATGDELYRLERPPFEADLAQKRAVVAQVAANLANAEIVLGRARSLLLSPAGRQSAVDEATANHGALVAQLAAARAAQRTAEINLDYTLIRAPTDGKITRTNVTEGNVVGPGSGPLATIVSQDPMYVTFPVAARVSAELLARAASHGGLDALVVRVRLSDGSLYEAAGRLDYVDPSVAAVTDTATWRAVVPNPRRAGARRGHPGDRALGDGQFVTAEVGFARPEPVLVVPRVAVQTDGQGSFVWLVGEARAAQQVRIRTGQSDAASVAVTAGLQAGQLVAVDGFARLRPGAPVQPIAQPTAPPAPGGRPTAQADAGRRVE